MVLDDHRLFPDLAKVLGKGAGLHVRTAAGRDGHDEADTLAGKLGCEHMG